MNTHKNNDEEAHYEEVAYADDIAEGSEDLIPEDYERHYCAEDGEDWPCTTVRNGAVAHGTE
jgi:hypothetical protein